MDTRKLEFVKNYYGVIPTAKIAEILGRSFEAIRWVICNQKQKLMDPNQPWTEEKKQSSTLISLLVAGLHR